MSASPDLGYRIILNAFYPFTLDIGDFLQRLFSMFPNGWPGRGLLLLRVVVATILIHDGISALMGVPQRGPIAVQVIAAVAGILLLVGLWTPLGGAIVALSEIWIAVAGTEQPRGTILMATLGIALAALGPGALSIDARLFGRKRLDI